MPQRKSGVRFGHACPAFLVIAKSAEAENAGTTQHRAKQLMQSARRLARSPSGAASSCSCLFDKPVRSPVQRRHRSRLTVADRACPTFGIQRESRTSVLVKESCTMVGIVEMLESELGLSSALLTSPHRGECLFCYAYR